jgi:hypothetical protein
MKKNILFCLAIHSCVTNAQILQYQYSNGTLIYSDRLPYNMQTNEFKTIKIKNKKSTVIESNHSNFTDNSDIALKTLSTKSTRLSITAPHDGQTFWSNTITISLLVEPSLNADDLILLYLDGVAQGKGTQQLSQSISNLTPGTHEIWAELKDQKGVTLNSTKKMIFYVHQHTAES